MDPCFFSCEHPIFHFLEHILGIIIFYFSPLHFLNRFCILNDIPVFSGFSEGLSPFFCGKASFDQRLASKGQVLNIRSQISTKTCFEELCQELLKSTNPPPRWAPTRKALINGLIHKWVTGVMILLIGIITPVITIVGAHFA